MFPGSQEPLQSTIVNQSLGFPSPPQHTHLQVAQNHFYLPLVIIFIYYKDWEMGRSSLVGTATDL